MVPQCSWRWTLSFSGHLVADRWDTILSLTHTHTHTCLNHVCVSFTSSCVSCFYRPTFVSFVNQRCTQTYLTAVSSISIRSSLFKTIQGEPEAHTHTHTHTLSHTYLCRRNLWQISVVELAAWRHEMLSGIWPAGCCPCFMTLTHKILTVNKNTFFEFKSHLRRFYNRDLSSISGRSTEVTKTCCSHTTQIPACYSATFWQICTQFGFALPGCRLENLVIFQHWQRQTSMLG